MDSVKTEPEVNDSEVKSVENSRTDSMENSNSIQVDSKISKDSKDVNDKPKSGSSTPNPLKRQKVSEEPEIPTNTNEPIHEVVGGSSLRQYLNKHLTAHILEGLRLIANEKPENPLKALGEFLIERSSKVE